MTNSYYKKDNFYFTSLKTKFLNKKQISSICKLKNEFWPWTHRKQLEWYQKNVKKDDINNMLMVNDKLAGFTLLRKRKFYINNKSLIFFYFDTFVVGTKFRNKGYGKALLLFNIKIIKKLKKHAFFTCTKKFVPFYSKYNWKLLPNENFKIMDHKHFWFTNEASVRGMTFNFKRKVKKKIFYYIN